MASYFITSLKAFILSTINVRSPRTDLDDRLDKSVIMDSPAQQLIDALGNFISSFTQTPPLQHKSKNGGTDEKRLPENLSFDATLSVHHSGNIPANEYVTMFTTPPPFPAEKPHFLKLALEETRYRIFNKMPIRLLSFDSTGLGIELLERSVLWDRISTLMERDFNEDGRFSSAQHGGRPATSRSWVIGQKIDFEGFISKYTGYAVLSHTWLQKTPGEVTYGAWSNGNVDVHSLGYQKLSNFCKVSAKEHNITLAWVDTICINKDSSAELDESIRSMFKWYRDSSLCITYLAQTTTFRQMRNDVWFTRGWTLQELLAPSRIKFYGADWKQLVPSKSVINDKDNIGMQAEIFSATTLTARELRDFQELGQASRANIAISRKMQWAANRKVTREEDIAYSLMGIFDVSFPIAYGEGAQRAFFRLVQQILNSSHKGIQDIMNWGYGPTGIKQIIPHVHPTSLIPSSPKQYLWRSERVLNWLPPSTPITFTHLGLHLSVLLMPTTTNDLTSPIGDYYAHIEIDEAVVDSIALPSIIFPGQRYKVLESSEEWGYANQNFQNITLGVLNFTTTESMVHLPFTFGMTCFAVCLYFGGTNPAEAVSSGNVWIIRTSIAVTFQLKTTRPVPMPWLIPKRDLSKHGMQLLDMHL